MKKLAPERDVRKAPAQFDVLSGIEAGNCNQLFQPCQDPLAHVRSPGRLAQAFAGHPSGSFLHLKRLRTFSTRSLGSASIGILHARS